MTHLEFEKLVAEAIDSLSENIQKKMDNVEIVVERGSPQGPYLGLYEGVPTAIAWFNWQKKPTQNPSSARLQG